MPAFALGIQKMIFISKKVQSCVCYIGMFHQQYINYVIQENRIGGVFGPTTPLFGPTTPPIRSDNPSE